MSIYIKMFGSVTNLDEDLELDNSFFPVITSTGNEKRGNELALEKNAKRFKTENIPQHVDKPIANISSFENCGTEKSFSPGRIAKRMFPGPAGLLTDSDNYSESKCGNNSNKIEDFLLCSQRTVSTFMEKPWTMMKTDYYSIGSEQLYDKYTISWIKQIYCPKNCAYASKTPFLAAVIQHLEIVDAKIPSVHITLKDPTGVIDGTILYSFYKGIVNHLTVGSVVILKQFGVLNNKYGHCLTITANNLLVIYHLRDQYRENDQSCDMDKNEHIEKMVFQQSSVDDIWKEINCFKDLQINSNHYKNDTFSNSKGSRLDLHPTTPFSNNLTPNKKDSSNSTNFMLPKFKQISSTISTNVLQDLDISQKSSVVTTTKEKFDFKKKDKVCNIQNAGEIENIFISSSQISVKADKKDSDIWKNALEDVDTDSLFGDF